MNGQHSNDRREPMTSKPDFTPPEAPPEVGQFALLKVASIEPVGAFLDWGKPKDLFLPFAEQAKGLRVGQSVIVFLYIDNTQRISASMRLDRHFSKAPPPYEVGQKVNLLIFSRTDLGYKAIIEGQHQGLIFEAEVFRPLHYGDKTVGYIKSIRDDGKIDLSLQATGHKGAEGIGPKIMELLQAKGGFLPIHDKTEAEQIYKLFGVSKKKYKIALGGLYKNRQITVDSDGIRLVDTSKAASRKN